MIMIRNDFFRKVTGLIATFVNIGSADKSEGGNSTMILLVR